MNLSEKGHEHYCSDLCWTLAYRTEESASTSPCASPDICCPQTCTSCPLAYSSPPTGGGGYSGRVWGLFILLVGLETYV